MRSIQRNTSSGSRRMATGRRYPILHQSTTSREKCTGVQTSGIQIMFHTSDSHTANKHCGAEQWCLPDVLTSAEHGAANILQDTADVMRSDSGSDTRTIHHRLLLMRWKNPGEGEKRRALLWGCSSVSVRVWRQQCGMLFSCQTESVRPH